MLKYFVVWCRERIVVIYRSSLIARGSGAPTFVRAMQKSGFDLRVLRMLLYTASGNKERSPGLGSPTRERKILCCTRMQVCVTNNADFFDEPAFLILCTPIESIFVLFPNQFLGTKIYIALSLLDTFSHFHSTDKLYCNLLKLILISQVSLKVREVLGSACSVRDTCKHQNIKAEGITQFLKSSAIQNFHST